MGIFASGWFGSSLGVVGTADGLSHSMIMLDDRLWITGQLTLASVRELQDAGFTAVMCNRPDAEEVGQPSMDTIASALQAAGITFLRYPVNADDFPGDHLDDVSRFFRAEGKLLAYCRTGNRSANLWIVSQVPGKQSAARDVVQSVGMETGLADRHLAH